jgi:predicted RND superfamily exporter protein
VITTIILSIMLVLSLAALYFSVRLNLKLGRTILNVEDRVEESLDLLDEHYQRITNISNLSVMSDEPFVRDVMAALKAARNAVLLVANKLANFGPVDDLSQGQDDDNTRT